ncbi:iron-sulfur cluster assembly scaffold protein [Patescibacteria group bacterium]|nr:iron-sulfur cluster assembly scaffold protein [Patescibacteria group bacterium]
MNTLYSKEIMKHFRHPRNVGKMKNYDGLGKIGNLLCGDILWLYIKVGKDKKGREIIKKASFSTFGCTIAIANSSLITTMIKGKTLGEAMKITKEKLLKRLGKVPPFKIHCSLLAVDGLSEAIYDYFLKNKKEIPKELQKRHERIQKHLKIIEERYKEYVSLEKKILEK